MSTLRPQWLLSILVGSGVLGWCATLVTVRYGWPSPVLALSSLITVGAVAVLILILGLRVRRDRTRPAGARMNPLAAARSLVLAQAGAYAGALIAGWHGGVLVHRLTAGGTGSRVSDDAWIMVISGLVLIILGFVVEQFCRIPPQDGDDGSGDEPLTSRRPRFGQEGEGGLAREQDRRGRT